MGHFIIKFLRELNSADSSKSIVLAIVLGLIAGFLPTVNFFSFLIIFFVFVFRIPIGLFIASFGLFKLLGFFFDPLFNKIGYTVLTSGFLKPFWTFLYNIPLFRWSGFNNTVVMGSLILGILLGIVLYFILTKVIVLYRSLVFEKLRQNKFFSWLAPKEKKGFLRISGLIFISSFAILMSLFFIFLLDPIVKFALEKFLSVTTHKKVAIESVNTNLKNLSLDIKNMQIGDILFAKIYTDLDWNKIVWRKYKIDNLNITAQTNKNIYDLIKKKSNQNQNSLGFNINIKLPSPDTFLAKQELESIKAVNKLKTDYKKIEKDFKNLNINSYKQKFETLKSEIENLKNIKINSPEDFEKLLKKIDEIKIKSNKLTKEVKNNKNLLLKDKKLIKNDLKHIKTALNKDKQNIKSKYEMIKNKEYLKFTEAFLKPQISSYLKKITWIYEKIKPYIKSNKNKEKEYVRAKGIYIKFEDKIKYPDFVLVSSNVNLKTSIAKWNMKLKNISDNQSLLNKEGAILIKGKSKFFDVGGDVRYLNKIKFFAYGNKVIIKKLDLNVVNLNAFADIKMNGVLQNDLINAKTEINFYNAEFVLKKEYKILHDINSVKHFKIIIFLNGNLNSPKISINSDIDKFLSKIIKNKINKLINKKTQLAYKMINEKIKASLKGLNIKDLDIKIDQLNSLEKFDKIFKKEFKKIIESKKKDLLKNKIKGIISF